MACGNDFFAQQIPILEAQITAYNAMFDAFLANTGLQEYQLNTGQSDQKVRRADLSQMRLAYDSLYNRYATLHARVNGCGVLVAKAQF